METPPPPRSSPRLPGLEALRGVAAICILLLHTRAVFGGKPVFGKGYLAVEFFLMLSGFLMAYAQEARMGRDFAPLAFMTKRYWRLWPTMALGSAIGLPRLFLRTSGLGQFLGAAVPTCCCCRSRCGASCFRSTFPPGRSSSNSSPICCMFWCCATCGSGRSGWALPRWLRWWRRSAWPGAIFDVGARPESCWRGCRASCSPISSAWRWGAGGGPDAAAGAGLAGDPGDAGDPRRRLVA